MTETVVDSLLVQVRADTRSFAADVQKLRGELEGPLVDGVESASRRMQSALRGFITSGKFDFQDLRKLALSVIADIALAQIRASIGQTGGGKGGGGLLGSVIGGLLSGFAGRATGGPVTAGGAYKVGETGAELFVPETAGRIVPAAGGAGRPIAFTINVAAPAGSSPQLMQRSANQVAQAVRRALVSAERG